VVVEGGGAIASISYGTVSGLVGLRNSKSYVDNQASSVSLSQIPYLREIAVQVAL
jgi:hypothetical protein